MKTSSPNDISSKLPIAVSIGEPAGVGPDIILQLYADRSKLDLPAFVVFGDVGFLKARAKRIGLDLEVNAITSVEQAKHSFDMALPVIEIASGTKDEPGFLNPDNAALTIASIEHAVASVATGSVRAIVTAPIHKSNLYKAGFEHPGHTEFLASLCKVDGLTPRPVMMLAHGDKRAIPVTIHIALKDVFDKLTPGRIVQTVRIAETDLKSRFGIEKPRIGVTGLNPHAGEDGAMGTEEIQTITPAIKQLKDDFGIAVDGPLPADTAFAPHIWAGYDVIIAMYHDQALIPVKTIGFDAGVNITLGLPIVRTSPDHGTALGLAGTGTASSTSMHQAIVLADKMSHKK